MKVPSSLASLFSCCLVAACNNSSAPDVSNNPPPPPVSANLSMQFFGTGTGGLDRVKIPLLNINASSRPVNVGNEQLGFTIEFWIKGDIAQNPTLTCNAGPLAKDEWLTGAVIIDRDVLGDGDFGEYAVSLLGGHIAFAVSRSSGGQTLCGASNVLDGAWHHVALTREQQTGQMTIFVDGAQEVTQGNVGSSLNVSYNPAHATPNAEDPFLVLGAQKRDDIASRAFRGLIDELRISTVRRYTGTFQRPTAPFGADGSTAALYHFDEPAGTDIVDANGNASPGVLVPASATAAHRSTDVPF